MPPPEPQEGPAIRLDGESIRVELPRGWEGSITRNPARTRSLAPETTAPTEDTTSDDDPADSRAVGPDPGPRSNAGPGVQRAEDGAVVMPVVHLANFPLPAALDSFGSQAVAEMSPGDSLVVLVEYGPAEVGTTLFARHGVPRRLRAGDFSPRTLNRMLPDQVGTQVFATEAGRAFCLYVVLAGRARIGVTLRGVNDTLATLTIASR